VSFFLVSFFGLIANPLTEGCRSNFQICRIWPGFRAIFPAAGWPGVSFEQVFEKDGSLEFRALFFSPSGLRERRFSKVFSIMTI